MGWTFTEGIGNCYPNNIRKKERTQGRDTTALFRRGLKYEPASRYVLETSIENEGDGKGNLQVFRKKRGKQLRRMKRRLCMSKGIKLVPSDD